MLSEISLLVPPQAAEISTRPRPHRAPGRRIACQSKIAIRGLVMDPPKWRGVAFSVGVKLLESNGLRGPFGRYVPVSCQHDRGLVQRPSMRHSPRIRAGGAAAGRLRPRPTLACRARPARVNRHGKATSDPARKRSYLKSRNRRQALWHQGADSLTETVRSDTLSQGGRRGLRMGNLRRSTRRWAIDADN